MHYHRAVPISGTSTSSRSCQREKEKVFPSSRGYRYYRAITPRTHELYLVRVKYRRKAKDSNVSLESWRFRAPDASIPMGVNFVDMPYRKLAC
ncbi:hypothetical protein KQX54_020971 [Cotesia glomerata]|uniref:Uncharacterized protein n=1 Tax=Cotesia glomerata TaxID=32391 RepID=A0AAV7J6J0_COTGL|nr:hypothetical protein KQX54_020971 [Cotesia glomerata]